MKEIVPAYDMVDPHVIAANPLLTHASKMKSIFGKFPTTTLLDSVEMEE